MTARLDEPLGDGVRVIDADGNELPALRRARRTLGQLAGPRRAVAGLAGLPAGRRVRAGGLGTVGGRSGDRQRRATGCGSTRPAAARCHSLTDDGRELLADGKLGNELRSTTSTRHTRTRARARGTCCPRGRWSSRPSRAAESVQCYRSPLGERLVVRGRIGSRAALHPDADAVARRGARGLQHHDRRVHRRGQAAAAALAVPGAGGDAGQRGRRRGDRPRLRAATRTRHRRVRRHRETSRTPWTTRRTAGSGSSSAVRVRVGRRDAVRAVSVAEVVSPTEAESAPLARDLMVALVRAGVTATCSSADKPRYGDLDVDSNLPDARIALGGPDQNPFTAAVLAEADPAYTEELKRQLYADRRRPGCGCPPRHRSRRRGCPARTCAACGRCRCSSSPAGTASTTRSRRSSTTSPTPRSRSTNRRRRSWSRSSSGPSRCSTAACRASPSTPTAPCTRR